MKFDRNILPPIDEKINFTFPKFTKIKLANDAELFFVEKKKIPIVQMQLLFNCGSNFDPAGKKGLANIFAALIDEGAGNMDALQLSDQLERLGTSIRIYCNHDFITASLLCLKENLDQSLSILKMILNEPHFHNKDFEREKNRILVTLQQHRDDPEIIADVLFEKKIFESQKMYSQFSAGVSTDISNLKLDDVKNFYEDNFKNSIVSIFCCGDIDRDELKSKLDSSILATSRECKRFKLHCGEVENKKIFVHHKVDSPQVELRLGVQVQIRNENNFYARQIVNFILGGQFSSRLNLNLREKLGLTYGIRSSFNYFMNASYFQIATSVDVDNSARAMDEIIREKKLLAQTITDEEIKFAKDSIVRRFPLAFETNSQIVNWLGSAFIYKLTNDYLEKYNSEIESVTKEKIIKTIDEDFRFEDIIVLVGDSKRIKKSLEKNIANDWQLVEEQLDF